MFEQALYEYIANNFTVEGFTLNFGFGSISDGTSAPYIIQHNLDTNGDRRTLNNPDDFTDGESFMQWNIYCDNASNAFYLKTELMTFIAGLKVLTLDPDKYSIELNEHSSSPDGKDATTGLFIEVVARDITYHKE